MPVSLAEDPVLCAFTGCEHEARPRSAWCRGHDLQRTQGKRLTPLRAYERDPDRAVVTALEKWLETLDEHHQRIHEILAQGAPCGDLRGLCQAIQRRADVSAEDDMGWVRANRALEKAMERYVERKMKQARRRK
jgi:hypothetical protein